MSDKPAPDDKREINIAVAAEWLRRSDGTHWHVSEYQIGMGGPDGFTLRRAYRASEAQRASEAREPDIQVPDLAALRRDFVVNMLAGGIYALLSGLACLVLHAP